MNILLGKPVAEAWLEQLSKIDCHSKKLGIILVGDNPASARYIEKKQQAGAKLGIEVEVAHLSAESTKDEIISQIQDFNHREDIGGFIIQIPLPHREWEAELLNLVDAKKDIDGLTDANMNGVKDGSSRFVPATALAVDTLLRHYGLSWAGKTVAVVGQGRVTGRPIADLAEVGGATVYRLVEGDSLDILQDSDIVVATVGKPHLLSAKNFKPGVIVVDVGISLVDGKSIGDVDPDNLETVADSLVPVPGGVGPLTVVALLANFLKACEQA